MHSNLGNNRRGVHQHAQHGFGPGEHHIHSKSPVRYLLHFFCLHDGIIDVGSMIAVKSLRNLNSNVEEVTCTSQYLDENKFV